MTEMQWFAEYLKKKAEAGKYDGNEAWYHGMMTAAADAELWLDVIKPVLLAQEFSELSDETQEWADSTVAAGVEAWQEPRCI